MSFKNYVLERGLQKFFAGGFFFLCLIGSWKYFRRKGGLTRKVWRKNRRGCCDPERNYGDGMVQT